MTRVEEFAPLRPLLFGATPPTGATCLALEVCFPERILT